MFYFCSHEIIKANTCDIGIRNVFLRYKFSKKLYIYFFLFEIER